MIYEGNLIVKPRNSQSLSFSFPEAHKLKVEVYGIKDTDKGFAVRVFPGDSTASEVLGSSTRIVNISPGAIAVSVSNTKNIMRQMVVRIVLTLDAE